MLYEKRVADRIKRGNFSYFRIIHEISEAISLFQLELYKNEKKNTQKDHPAIFRRLILRGLHDQCEYIGCCHKHSEICPLDAWPLS